MLLREYARNCIPSSSLFSYGLSIVRKQKKKGCHWGLRVFVFLNLISPRINLIDIAKSVSKLIPTCLQFASLPVHRYPIPTCWVIIDLSINLSSWKPLPGSSPLVLSILILCLDQAVLGMDWSSVCHRLTTRVFLFVGCSVWSKAEDNTKLSVLSQTFSKQS